MKQSDFFARKEQAEFISKVYAETPLAIQKLFRQESELLQKALAGTRCVLEVGCGFGRVLEWVPEGVQYSGIDISRNYLAEAKSRNPRGDWICGDATSLPFRSGSFDAVFCVQNTLGNMEGLEEKVLSEMRRACGRNGRVILSVYSEDSFEMRRLWYDRLVDVGIFRRVWLDPQRPRVARSDTGWSSRCFERSEVRAYFEGASSVEITKLGSFLYFCTGKF
ncbi:MAG TPA: class I SAM-dependent methyltransferase [Acidobacteriota bacterium]|nr:class I SAM-dependent methyltransferase [Acidobacteriota bacterium]